MVNDPYEVLGVSRNATDDEIRKAYRELVKKYHPDKYQDNPLADLAEEKLREVNEAYDQIMNGRNASGAGGAAGYRTQGNSSYSGQNAAEFSEIRQDINSGNLDAAQAKLNRIQTKNAEWIFLSGMISLKRGWYDDARSKIAQAISMDPNNNEYRVIYSQLMQQGQAFRRQSYDRGYQSSNDSFCKACETYMCIDCMCPCF